MAGPGTTIEALERRSLLAAVADSTGLQAAYYELPNFGGASVARVDRAISFNWGSGPPAPSIGAEAFSARWTARMKAQTTETYRLMLLSESPVRLWINNNLVVDGWKTSSKPALYRGSVPLIGGRRYSIQIEMQHKTGPASIRFMWQTDTLIKQTVPSRLLTPMNASLQAKINHAMGYARDSIARTLREHSTPAASGYPSETRSDGTWVATDAAAWTSGFLGGTLWQLDQYLPGAGYDALATAWTTSLALQKSQPGDHFGRIWNTFKPLYDKTGDSTWRQILLDAAASKDAQFSALIGAFRTPEIVSQSGNAEADFGVLIDQTMDLDLMFWASAQTGNQAFRAHAIEHFQTVLSRMVRPDGSVFQRYFFNARTGSPIGGETYQGYSDSSTWSRGQAWAVYSFARIAEITGRADFLEAARRVADYFVTHLPADYVPFWDFQAPGIPRTYRDSSAAAIATGGLLRLSKLTHDANYLSAAQRILSNLLSSKYLTEGTGKRGVLNHGAVNVPKQRGVDASLVYGDFYLIEAINAYTNS